MIFYDLCVMCGTFNSMHMDVSASVCDHGEKKNHWSKLVELNHHIAQEPFYLLFIYFSLSSILALVSHSFIPFHYGTGNGACMCGRHIGQFNRFNSEFHQYYKHACH